MQEHTRKADARQSTRRAGRLHQARCTCGWEGQGFGKNSDAQWLQHLAETSK